MRKYCIESIHILTEIPLGYNVNSLRETATGLIAELTIGGTPCNAFGIDFANLTLDVTYDTDDR